MNRQDRDAWGAYVKNNRARALHAQGTGKDVLFGERRKRKRGCLDNSGTVASVLALQFDSSVKTDEPQSFMLSQERMLGGPITAEIIKVQSSKDHPEMCLMVHGVPRCYVLGFGYASSA